MLRVLVLFLLVCSIGCLQSSCTIPSQNPKSTSAHSLSKSIAADKDSLSKTELFAIRKKDTKVPSHKAIKGALLSTRFKSLEELKSVIKIEYFKAIPGSGQVLHNKPLVRLYQASNGRAVTSILKSGVSETDFMRARAGGFGDRLWLLINSPYAVFNRIKFLKVYYFSRRMDDKFGAGDPAFYDLAETTMSNISADDLALIQSEDLSEKGYINTFNHIYAQVFMTVLFSEKLADFIADAHERTNMPELITGKFTVDQLTDLEKGPIDNYVDIINNEWGQELGKVLGKKYNISSETIWTPELLASFLNDIQSYYSWAFQIGFQPYRDSDELVIKFSNKLNRIMGELYKLK